MKFPATSICRLVLSIVAGWVTLVAPAFAQSASQTLTLSPGWNAVWLEVEPVDANGQAKAPGEVFANQANQAIQIVASPKPLSGISEFFASDPGAITTFNQQEWQQWKRNDPAGLNNLSLINGNRAYLIQVAAGSPVVLTLSGKASFYRPSWIPDRYNLVGFGLQGTPTFEEFFLPSGTKHPVGKIFTLNASTGNWAKVLSTDRMVSGQAYWVFCSGQSNYMGPVSVDFDHAVVGELDFDDPTDAVVVGSSVDALELDLEEIVFSNSATATATPELDLITRSPGAGSLSLYVAKKTATGLGYSRGNKVDSTAGDGGSAALDKILAASQTTILTLGAQRNWNDNVRRTNLYRLKTGATSASFWLPVTAIRSGIEQAAGGSPGTPASEMTGLWVGEVSVTAATSIVEDGSPVRPAAGSAPMRILLHSDGRTVRLLSQVTIMQTKTADSEIKAVPVLVVDPAKIPFFEGIKERDGKRVGLRLEAVTYDMPRKTDGVSQGNLLEDPKFLTLPGLKLSTDLQAALGQDASTRTQAQKDLIISKSDVIAAAKLTIPGLLPDYLVSSAGRPPKLVEAYDLSAEMHGPLGAGQTLTVNLTLDPFHRSNPFRHAFHHDHTKGPQITRSYSLIFDHEQAIAGRLNGVYTETIKGLIKSDLTLTGRVELRRVSTVDTLQ